MNEKYILNIKIISEIPRAMNMILKSMSVKLASMKKIDTDTRCIFDNTTWVLILLKLISA